jgi:hypothetical protein
MWCTSCRKDVEPDAENALLYDQTNGWIHVRILPDGICIAHTTEGYPVHFRDDDLCGRLHRGEHLGEKPAMVLIGEFVDLDTSTGEHAEAVAAE